MDDPNVAVGGPQAEQLLKDLNADLCVIVVLGGPQGGTIDVATTQPILLDHIPDILQRAAKRLGEVARDHAALSTAQVPNV